MKVYISSYAAYNNGHHTGQWYDLDDYLYDFDQLHQDAQDYLDNALPNLNHEELLYSDWDNAPRFLTGECGIDWERIGEFLELDEDQRDIVCAYADCIGSNFDFEDAFEAHVAATQYWHDYRDLLIELWHERNEVPDHLAGYLCDDAIFSDMDQDYFHSNGHTFRNL